MTTAEKAELERLVADVEKRADEREKVRQAASVRTEARHLEELATRDARTLARELVIYKESLQTQITALQTSLMLLQQSRSPNLGWIVLAGIGGAILAFLVK